MCVLVHHLFVYSETEELVQFEIEIIGQWTDHATQSLDIRFLSFRLKIT